MICRAALGVGQALLPGCRWVAAGLLGSLALTVASQNVPGQMPGQVPGQVPGGFPAAGPSLSAPAARAPANAMAEAAQLVGVRRCLPAVNRLSSLSLQGAGAHDVVLDWDRQAADASAFFGLMGVAVPQSGVRAETLTVIPEQTGECTVMAERILWAPRSCAQLAREELPGYAVAPLVPGMAVLTHPSDTGSTVSLLEAGPGCMVIRRFVQYRWRDPSAPVVPSTPIFTGPRPSLPGR